MPATSLNFTGVPFRASRAIARRRIPTVKWAPRNTFQIVNEGYQGLDKTTGRIAAGTCQASPLCGAASVASAKATATAIRSCSTTKSPIVDHQPRFAGASDAHRRMHRRVRRPADATGSSYNRYDFHLGSNFSIIRTSSVWPDAYLHEHERLQFVGHRLFLGPQPFAFDRARMLLGLPATFVTTGVTGGSNEDVYLPSDLDGAIPPLLARAGDVRRVSQYGFSIGVFHFHVDFVTPANPSFTLFASPAASRLLRSYARQRERCAAAIRHDEQG